MTGEQNEVAAVGPDYQLRAQVSAIIKMNIEIVKMNATIIKTLMEPPTLIHGTYEGPNFKPTTDE